MSNTIEFTREYINSMKDKGIFLKTKHGQLDITKPVKYATPYDGEEDFVFVVTNYNEGTRRVYMRSTNITGMKIQPEVLSDIDELINI